MTSNQIAHDTHSLSDGRGQERRDSVTLAAGFIEAEGWGAFSACAQLQDTEQRER